MLKLITLILILHKYTDDIKNNLLRFSSLSVQIKEIATRRKLTKEITLIAHDVCFSLCQIGVSCSSPYAITQVNK